MAVLAASTAASADPTSGVDGALFRSSYDAGGLFSLEGARLLPRRDLSFKLLMSYARSPLTPAVPGIGDTSGDRILNYLLTIDMAFGLSLSDRVAIGIDAAGFRTGTGSGYGVRGAYASRGGLAKPSTGLISLRPLSNIDPSAKPGDGAAYLGDELAGPLDARFGLKLALIDRPLFAVTAVGSVFLPVGGARGSRVRAAARRAVVGRLPAVQRRALLHADLGRLLQRRAPRRLHGAGHRRREPAADPRRQRRHHDRHRPVRRARRRGPRHHRDRKSTRL